LEQGLNLIVGIDIGASTTKGVILEDSEIIYKYTLPTLDAATSTLKVMENLASKIQDRNAIGLVAISGGGSRQVGNTLLGLPVVKVDEIRAIGLGGLFLVKKLKGLIVSIGTGTAMVAAYKRGVSVNHVGGTGVGGGTILGLSKRMLGINNFEAIENMASQGDSSKVDLTVADIVGGPVGIIPAEATASNFGRLTGTVSKEDIAAGIFNLVSQVIGILAAMAAKAYGLQDDVVLVGRLAKSKIVFEAICKTTELFGVKATVPKDCDYCTAVGAAGYALL